MNSITSKEDFIESLKWERANCTASGSPWCKDYKQVLVYSYLRFESIRKTKGMVNVSCSKIAKEYKGVLSEQSVRTAIKNLVNRGVIYLRPVKESNVNSYILVEDICFNLTD